jgi:hypothetical protein
VLRREPSLRHLIGDREARTRIQSSHNRRGVIDPGAASKLLGFAQHVT